MIGQEEVRHIYTEIDDLLSMVSFGSHKLDQFENQINRLQRNCDKVSDREHLHYNARQCDQLQHAIHGTEVSLREWQDKISFYLQQLTASQELDPTVSHLVPAKQLDKKITQLSKTIKRHTNRVLSLQQALQQVDSVLQHKRFVMKPNIKRVMNPLSVEQVSDELMPI